MNAAGADTDTVLRKRQLTVRTTSSNGGNGFRVGGGKGAAAATPPEPVSPSARLLEDFFIVVVIGIATPVNDPVARAGIAAQFARYPRFRSIQVTDEDGGNPRWVRTTLNVDDHIIYPELDMDAVAADPDKAVEDYVASLSTKPMDESRPLWEFHVLDFPTSEAAATTAIRVHHSLGDGMSLLTLLMACTRSAADPARLPAMPPQPTRTGAIYARPRPPASAGALAFAAWLWSFVALAWHTVVDVASFFATTMFLKDPHTLFKRVKHGEFQRKRIVHRGLSFDDVKLVKNAMNCAAAAIFHRMISHTTISFSNMIGPVEQVEFCGHPVVFIAPSGYGPPEALTVNFQSYVNTMMVNLAVDEAQFPDCHELLDDFSESLRQIKDAALSLGKHHTKA
ncbi:hypothetical protein DAI22_01g340300 [Oryza sativa Japonica Group]|nr:hypothetical protein DAI22_01g340300 [Oryza sativa Japonica Group]